jgi:hypothetical protein
VNNFTTLEFEKSYIIYKEFIPFIDDTINHMSILNKFLSDNKLDSLIIDLEKIGIVNNIDILKSKVRYQEKFYSHSLCQRYENLKFIASKEFEFINSNMKGIDNVKNLTSVFDRNSYIKLLTELNDIILLFLNHNAFNKFAEFNEYIDDNTKKINDIKENFISVTSEKINTINLLEEKMKIKYENDQIKSLKDFYTKRQEALIDEQKHYNRFYYFFIFLQAFLLIIAIIDVNYSKKIFVYNNTVTETSKTNNISTTDEIQLKSNSSHNNNIYIIYVSFILILALIQFLISDYNLKRNISKQILDEIDQKTIILDMLPVLLARNNEYKNINEKKYESEILTALINNIISIKNFGYNKDDKNDNYNIISAITKIIKKD